MGVIWERSKELVIFDACKKLEEILQGVCDSHGFQHALKVMKHTMAALSNHSGPSVITEEETVLITLAALCHDADDRKFWKNSDNANCILSHCSRGRITPGQRDLVQRLIGYVSCYENRDKIPEECVAKPEYLYPRYSDRLEAMGKVGLFRTYVYTVGKNQLLFTEQSPRPTTEAELWEYASDERFQRYEGKSDSMMCHFYDKLLHIGGFSSGNTYLQEKASKRQRIMVDVCLYFGIHGKLHPIFEAFSPGERTCSD